jgi:hypothetical protein
MAAVPETWVYARLLPSLFPLSKERPKELRHPGSQDARRRRGAVGIPRPALAACFIPRTTSIGEREECHIWRIAEENEVGRGWRTYSCSDMDLPRGRWLFNAAGLEGRLSYWADGALAGGGGEAGEGILGEDMLSVLAGLGRDEVCDARVDGLSST